MQYKFYDPPLNYYPCHHSKSRETRATLDDILAIEKASFFNGDALLAELDYQIHFGHDTDISTRGRYIEAPEYGEIALCYGGSVAVYRECIKRNITINQLFGFDDSATKVETPIELLYECDMPIGKCTHEDCLAYLKKRREELLERQRQRQQTQQ